MSIWTYAQQARDIEHFVHSGNECFFCHDTMIELRHERVEYINTFSSARVFGCARCGWWRADEFAETKMFRRIGYTVKNTVKGAAGSLLELDLSDHTAPIQAIRDHLMIRPKSLGTVHCDRFEKVVADVYKDLGFHSIATASSGDDGIDVILENGGVRIGIQVKRYKDKVQVEEIRSLAGALVLNDMTQGIFLTTSNFTTGAPRTVREYERRGFQIELVNGERFLQQLEIAQRAMYRNREDFDEEEILKQMVVIDQSTTWEDLEQQT
jgi:restriction system protein